MLARDLPSARPAGRLRRAALAIATSLLVLALGGCENRGDLLGVELVVFSVGEWVGVGPQGEELRFVLERDDDEAVLTSFIVNLPGLGDVAQGEPEACATMVDAFNRFGNLDLRIPLRNAGFRFRTPNDFRVDNDGFIQAEIVGRFDAPDSAMVDADIEMDVTRVLPCRAELMVSWQMAPVGP